VPVQESLESVVVDVKPFGVPESVGTCVLALEEQALEDLPPARTIRGWFAKIRALPDGVDASDLLGHVFVFVVGVDDCVELEEDVVLAAPVAHLYDLLEVVLVALSSTDRLVGVFVEGVARDRHDVHVASIGLEPLLGDEGPVGNHRH
jgi:hypothetical protein